MFGSTLIANPATEPSGAPLTSIEAGETEEERGVSTDFEVELFIEEIRKLGCLWNTSLSSYKDRNAKQNAWQILSNIFNKDGKNSIMNSLNNLINI